MILGSFLALATVGLPTADRPTVSLPAPLVPLGLEELTDPAGGLHPTPLFDVDEAGLDRLARHAQVRLTGWPLPEGGTVDLDLERLPVAASTGGELFVDGLPAGRLVGEDVSLWTGSVVGEPGSDVYLALSDAGSRGWVRTAGATPRLSHLLAEPDPVHGWDDPRARLVGDAALGFGPATVCGLDDLPDGGALPRPRDVATGSPKPGVLDAAKSSVPVLRELTISVETDHDFYAIFGDLGATEAYALSLMGAVSARYREQVDLVITLPYLGLYTTPSDPWLTPDAGGGSVDLLYEFQAAWYPAMPVEASLGHFLSGAGLGGGVAWLDTVCVPQYRFGVSGNLGGDLPLPVAQGPINWDFMVVAHEIGHNLSSPHTHDFCPPLDECSPSGYWGQCQDEELCITDGTVMSYCHLCPGGLANITTYFHPTVVQTMRARVEDSCLPPFEGLFLAELGGGISGSVGQPTITPTFDPVTDVLALDYADAPAGSLAVLVVGATQLDLPLLGGTLVPTPTNLLTFVTAGSSGGLPGLSFAGLPVPAGVTLYTQAWFSDPVTPFGFSASDGAELELFVPDPPAALSWIQHPTNGREYALTPAATWFKAQETAVLSGGHLATITDPALETWLTTTFVGSGLFVGDAYIGFTDQTAEGSFTWIGGDPVGHTNWAANEPNDSGGYEDYAVWGGGPWNDINGFNLRPGLIER